MRQQGFSKTVYGLMAIGLAVAFPLGAPRAVAQYDDAGTDPDVEVLTRGPIHEAFAAPSDYDPEPGPVIPAEPPPVIEEIPPLEKPEGDNVLWIPGYWSWDEEREDFIWVSGIWRIPPPNCSWVPGYWTHVVGGYTWTPGFWMLIEVEEVAYLPQPPASLEVGPSSPAPAADYLWTPGCWVWSGGRYAWRPGYWMRARPNWIWVSAHYVWTPHGYVYVDGYWDWTLDCRGVLFAPVYVPRHVWVRPRYVYCPSIVVHSSFLTISLFIGPHHHHYCFGDYYGPHYYQWGYRPWFHYSRRHRGCDPIYVHHRWRHERNDPHWGDRQRRDYEYRDNHPDARPPRTYREQVADASNGRGKEFRIPTVAAPLKEVVRKPDPGQRFEQIDANRRETFDRQARELGAYREERAKWESRGETPGKGTFPRPEAQVPRDARQPSIEVPSRPETRDRPGLQPKESERFRTVPKSSTWPQTSPGQQDSRPSDRVRIPKSPVYGQPPSTSDRSSRPPSKPELPKPDTSIRYRSVPRDSSSGIAPRSPGITIPSSPSKSSSDRYSGSGSSSSSSSKSSSRDSGKSVRSGGSSSSSGSSSSGGSSKSSGGSKSSR